MYTRIGISRSSDDPFPADAALGPLQTLRSGTVFVRQGDPVQWLHLIVSGCVTLAGRSRTGRDVVVAVRTPGWLVGAPAAMLDCPSPVEARCLVDCDLRPLAAGDLRRLQREDPRVAAWLQRMLARDAYEQAQTALMFASMAAPDRLRRILTRLSASIGTTRDRGEVRFAVGREELAQLIGATPEHVSRTLALLEADGFLRRDGAWVVITGFASGRRNLQR